MSDALEFDHKCVIMQLDFTVTPLAPAYRAARSVRAVSRAAFSEDLQTELPSVKTFRQSWTTSQTPPADQYHTTLRTSRPLRAGIAAKRERREAELQLRSTGLTVHCCLYKKAKRLVTTLVPMVSPCFTILR